MKVGQKLFIFYIYLVQQIQNLIKKDFLYKRIETPANRPEDKFFQKGWLGKLLLRAVVTSFLVFFTIVYLHQGKVFFNADGSTILNRIMPVEVVGTFVFFFLSFLNHRGISWLISRKPFTDLNYFLKAIIEALLVILTALVLLFISLLLPFMLIFPEIEITAEKLRLNYILMAIISLFFYYFLERERSKKKLQAEMLRSARLQKENFEAQLQNLKEQVNPHFLFNSLNVLGQLINVDREKAKEFVNRLSDVYRSFLDNSSRELISLKEELEVVEAYNFLLKTRFGETLIFETEIATDPEKYYLPPGALQSLIENAIKHNGSTLKDPLRIKIFTRAEDLIVENPIKPRPQEVPSTHTGLKNLSNRYNFLTERKASFEKVGKKFIATIPLLRV